jgi:hypothetical protein
MRPVAALAGAPTIDGTPESSRDRARKILGQDRQGTGSGSSYQTDLPALTSTASDPRGRDTYGAGGATGSLPAAPGAPLGTVVLVLAIVVVLVWLLTVVREWHRERPPTPSEMPHPSRESAVPAGSRSVDELAADGRFAEALRALLIEALRCVALRTRFSLSLTTREMIRAAPLEPAGRTALAALAAQEERIEFGGRRAERRDYEEALFHYRLFLATWRNH